MTLNGHFSIQINFRVQTIKSGFNYDCLFNELKNQRKGNRLETQKTANTQIKCPYCRHNHKGILPLYNGYKKLKYVNWSSSNVKILVKCKAILKSGKRKGKKCGCIVKNGNYCGRHKNIMTPN